MTRTLIALLLFFAALSVTVATATGAEIAARKSENPITVDLYKDPG